MLQKAKHYLLTLFPVIKTVVIYNITFESIVKIYCNTSAKSGQTLGVSMDFRSHIWLSSFLDVVPDFDN